MNTYAAYNEADWICNVHAETELEALHKAQALYPHITRVELVAVEKER